MPLDKTIIDRTLTTSHGEAAYHIVTTLMDNGYDAWWVGGAVRDMLKNTIPEDIDIGTDATPDQISSLFQNVRQQVNAYASVRVPIQHHVFEVTTFRKDSDASDGRRPDTIEYSNREHDAMRRDFTVNAMYIHPVSRELYDPHSGEKDLDESLIRFIGEPGVRIEQDSLRLLRAVRFRALIDGQYHPDTYKALREHATSIERVSGKRVEQELSKMLLGPHPARAFEDLWETGMLTVILPELADCKGVAQPKEYHEEGDVWEHTMCAISAFESDDNRIVRWATLLHDIGKARTFSMDEERIRFDEHAPVSGELIKDIGKRLQMNKADIEALDWMVSHHMSMATFLDESLTNERKAYWFYHPHFSDLLRLFRLDAQGTVPSDLSMYNDVLAAYHAFLDANPKPEKPLLSGEDIMRATGLQPGEEVGNLLKQLAVLQHDKTIQSKEEAKAWLEGITRDTQ